LRFLGKSAVIFIGKRKSFVISAIVSFIGLVLYRKINLFSNFVLMEVILAIGLGLLLKILKNSWLNSRLAARGSKKLIEFFSFENQTIGLIKFLGKMFKSLNLFESGLVFDLIGFSYWFWVIVACKAIREDGFSKSKADGRYLYDIKSIALSGIICGLQSDFPYLIISLAIICGLSFQFAGIALPYSIGLAIFASFISFAGLKSWLEQQRIKMELSSALVFSTTVCCKPEICRKWQIIE
jgi:hypothetical protein